MYCQGNEYGCHEYQGSRKNLYLSEIYKVLSIGTYIWFYIINILDRSTDLDIPLDLVELSEYNATLSHKACHSFGQEQNARFENLYHPR